MRVAVFHLSVCLLGRDFGCEIVCYLQAVCGCDYSAAMNEDLFFAVADCGIQRYENIHLKSLTEG